LRFKKWLKREEKKKKEKRRRKKRREEEKREKRERTKKQTERGQKDDRRSTITYIVVFEIFVPKVKPIIHNRHHHTCTVNPLSPHTRHIHVVMLIGVDLPKRRV